MISGRLTWPLRGSLMKGHNQEAANVDVETVEETLL